MLNYSSARYDFVAKSFHWIMAALFVGMYAVAYTMINIDRSPFRFTLYDLHKATGLLLLLLVMLRLQWRWIGASPSLPPNMPSWQKALAKANVVLLYVLMFFMPISGFLTSSTGGHEVKFYGLFMINPIAHNESVSELFSLVHYWLSWVLVALFALHLVAALYHHYISTHSGIKS